MNRNFKWLVLGAALGFMGSFGVACGPVNRCTPQSCPLGCCDASGTCQGGASNAACGSGGQVCSTCAFSQTCQAGACVLNSSGTGGGFGTGGGQGTGGGSGTGGGFWTGGGLGTGGGQGTSGDITFTWDFAGRSCLQTTEVARVVVSIPGQPLQNNGVYGCNNGGTDGIRLLNFAAGTYSFTLQGQTQAGAVVYEARGQVAVNGNVALHVSLAPTQLATREVYVRALFPQNATNPCALAPTVEVTVDTGAATAVSCTQISSGNGIVLQNLALGRHNLDLAARDQSGFYYFRTVNSFDVTAGSNAYDFSLQWIVGSLPLKWAFSNGVAQLNCAQAGVIEVQVTLRDSQNADATFLVPCERSLGVQGTQVPYLYYGNYQVFLQAVGTGNVLYRSSLVAPPVRTVTEGEFPDIDNPTLTPAILMTP